MTSIAQQDYPSLPSTRVFVADAASTDGTPALALAFCDRLDICVIPGGLPSVGRNAGARLAATPYVLFLDADMELRDPTLVRRALELMQHKRLHCLTTNIWCNEGSPLDKLLYFGSNVSQYLSRLAKPFSTGMFMMFDAAVFRRLGGFDERALYAEDYLLSKKISRSKFRIVRGSALTTNRRFKKSGHVAIVRLFLKTALNTWNDQYFLRDQQYWQSAP